MQWRKAAVCLLSPRDVRAMPPPVGYQPSRHPPGLPSTPVANQLYSNKYDGHGIFFKKNKTRTAMHCNGPLDQVHPCMHKFILTTCKTISFGICSIMGWEVVSWQTLVLLDANNHLWTPSPVTRVNTKWTPALVKLDIIQSTYQSLSDDFHIDAWTCRPDTWS